MTKKHTPEWEQHGYLVGVPNDLAANQDKMDWIADCNNEANARLIAAAPRLLEALEDIIYRSSIDAAGVPFIESSIKERAIAAIAAAKGETL